MKATIIVALHIEINVIISPRYMQNTHYSEGEMWETLKAVSCVIGCHGVYDDEHPARMAEMARRIGNELAMEPQHIRAMEYAVLLHDIGQLHVRETIMRKPGRLTREEFLEVQAHPIESEKVISLMPHMSLAAHWVRWHHEWWDGSGYPDRLRGAQIPLPSRILVAVDAFAAMQCDRPYRGAMTREEALNELRLMAGIQFDPVVVKTILKLSEKNML
ncbi:MAG: HD domain-containing phosphohydrolase [bacterium]